MLIFSLDGWSRLLPTRFLVSRRTQDPTRLHYDFSYGTCTLFGQPFNAVLLSSFLSCRGPTTPVRELVWAPPLSLAATYGIILYFLFLRVLRCFSSPGTSLMSYVFAHGCHPITDDGFPHSDICGSLRAYRSPQHFAVCCVLLQFQVPRHPPYALSYLITTFLRVFAFSKVY